MPASAEADPYRAPVPAELADAAQAHARLARSSLLLGVMAVIGLGVSFVLFLLSFPDLYGDGPDNTLSIAWPLIALGLDLLCAGAGAARGISALMHSKSGRWLAVVGVLLSSAVLGLFGWIGWMLVTTR